MSLDLGLKIAALCITIYCLVFYLSGSGLRSRHSYLLLAVDGLICCISTVVITFLTPGMPRDIEDVLLLKGETFYVFFHALIAPFLVVYLLGLFGLHARQHKMWFFLSFLPVLFLEALIVLNVTNPVLFHFEGGVYTHGSLWALLVVIPAVYFLTCFLLLIVYRNALPRRTFIPMMAGFLVSVAGVLLQQVFGIVKIELFSQSITILLLLLTIESPVRGMELRNGVHNRKALNDTLRRLSILHQPFNVLDIRVSGASGSLDLLDTARRSDLDEAVANVLKDCTDPRTLYFYSPCHYIVIRENMKPGETDVLCDAIQRRVATTYVIRTIPVDVTGFVTKIRYPKDTDSIDTIGAYLAIDSEALTGRTDLGIRERILHVRTAVQHAVDNHGFSLALQPIFEAGTRRVAHAEVFLRLQDGELGYIRPGEVIPIAERTGTAPAIGWQQLEKLCRLIKQYGLQDLGIFCFHVNLSPYQLLDETFADRAASLVRSQMLDPLMFAFEISDTTFLEQSEIAKNSMEQLHREGFHLILDHFGASATNITKVEKMKDIDGIKIAKDVLSLAMNDRDRRTMLDTVISHLSSIGKIVYQTGVETREEADFATAAGCRYLQGYYLCEPVLDRSLATLTAELTRKGGVHEQH